MTASSLNLGGNASGAITKIASMLNRHGLVTGATGTGKTVTLQVLAESLSRLGVPVFTADVKGDLSGLAAKGRSTPKLDERLSQLGLTDFSFESFPCRAVGSLRPQRDPNPDDRVRDGTVTARALARPQ